MSATDVEIDPRRVTVPEGECGPWKIDRFTIERGDIGALSYALRGRSPGLGTFTRLCRNGAVWMSDTVAEQHDHSEIRYQMSARDRCERPWSLLIHGLGIGMILHWALQSKHCERIDVVELDADVITLVGAHYEAMAADAGIALTIHHGDCNTIKWPTGSRWTLVWHDIWQNLCEDNLPEMHRLHRSFGRRCDWQGSWGRDTLEREKRRTADAWWRR